MPNFSGAGLEDDRRLPVVELRHSFLLLPSSLRLVRGLYQHYTEGAPKALTMITQCLIYCSA